MTLERARALSLNRKVIHARNQETLHYGREEPAHRRGSRSVHLREDRGDSEDYYLGKIMQKAEREKPLSLEEAKKYCPKLKKRK
jgi:hypothetical protein